MGSGEGATDLKAIRHELSGVLAVVTNLVALVDDGLRDFATRLDLSPDDAALVQLRDDVSAIDDAAMRALELVERLRSEGEAP